jgi:hypothetical protein
MSNNAQRLGKETAQAYMDEIWDSDSDEMAILDCRVAKRGTTYELRVSYELYGEAGMRTLRSVESAERFLREPFDLPNIASPEIESWDADIGL